MQQEALQDYPADFYSIAEVSKTFHLTGVHIKLLLTMHLHYICRRPGMDQISPRSPSCPTCDLLSLMWQGPRNEWYTQNSFKTVQFLFNCQSISTIGEYIAIYI